MSRYQGFCCWLYLCSLPMLIIQECQGKQESHNKTELLTEKQPHTTQEKPSPKENKSHTQVQDQKTETGKKGKKKEKKEKKEKKKKGKMNRAVQVTTVAAMTLSAAASAKKIAEDE